MPDLKSFTDMLASGEVSAIYQVKGKGKVKVKVFYSPDIPVGF